MQRPVLESGSTLTPVERAELLEWAAQEMGWPPGHEEDFEALVDEVL